MEQTSFLKSTLSSFKFNKTLIAINIINAASVILKKNVGLVNMLVKKSNKKKIIEKTQESLNIFVKTNIERGSPDTILTIHSLLINAKSYKEMSNKSVNTTSQSPQIIKIF